MFNKKLLSSIDLGKYKKKNPYKNDIILDPMGQWKHPGKNTRIPSSSITMKGVNYPVLGVSNTGQKQMMQPGKEYNFPGADYVDEYPQMKKGGLIKAQKGIATYQDSLDVYNNALQQEAYYNKFKPYYDSVEHMKDYIIDLAQAKQAEKDLLKYTPSLSWTPQDKANFQKTKNIIKNNKDKNIAYLTDIITGQLDPNAPGLRYDARIKPQGSKSYSPYNIKYTSKENEIADKFFKKYYDDLSLYDGKQSYMNKKDLLQKGKKLGYTEKEITGILYKAKKYWEANEKLKGWETIIPYYDPLAVKPGRLLTDDEIKKRVDKYGTDGIPEDKLEKLGLKDSRPPKKNTSKVVKSPCSNPITTVVNNVPEKAPFGKKLVGTNSETLPVTGKKCEYVKTINPIYEDLIIEPIKLGRFPERIDNGPLPPLQVHDYSLPDSIEAPQYTLDPYTADRLSLDVKLPQNKIAALFDKGVIDSKGHIALGKRNKTRLIPRIVQKLTGYDPAYFEGYEDEEGNFVPGELDYGNVTGSEMEFRGAASLRDYMNQQKYKKEYEEYDKKLDAWLEQYEQSKKKQAEGQAFKKGGAKKKYTSDIINSTNYLFAEHPLFKKKKQSKKRIYDPKAKYYADGGENLQEKCPPYHYWNGETCVPVDRKLAPLDPQYLLENPDVATNMQIEPEVSVSPLGSDFSKALSWINKWHDSPMHDKMLLKSSKLSTRTDSDAQKLFKEIKDLRKKNIQTIPSLNIDFDKTDPNAKLYEDKYDINLWGMSDSNTGNVSVFQSLPGNKQMLVHEASHSADRPAGKLSRLIPYNDQLAMQYRTPLNWKNSQYGKNEMAKFKNSQGKLEDEYMGEEEIPRDIYEQNQFDDWNKYLLSNQGTEVRARLNEIRHGAQEQNIYDPFNRKITGRQFKKLDEKLLYSKPLDELRKTYSDKDIKWMLNNISKNDNETDDTIQYSKNGGQLSKAKYGHSIGNLIRKQNGGVIELELTDDQIEEYRKGGYVVEDISVPSLTRMQPGGLIKSLKPVIKGTENLKKIKETFKVPDELMNIAHILQEATGEALMGKTNRESIAKGNKWLQDWINNPITQAKIQEDIFNVGFNPRLGAINYKYFTPRYGDIILNPKDKYLNALDLAKNFKPVSQEYPFKSQILDLLKGRESNTRNFEHIHAGNVGVTNLHQSDPINRDLYSRGYFLPSSTKIDSNYKPYRNYGSYISRSPFMSPYNRESVTIHEGTHDWITDYLLNTTGQKDLILNSLDPDVRAIHEKWKDPKQYEGLTKEEKNLGYYANPTEIHARIMQLRRHNNLTPFNLITDENAPQILEQINSGNVPFDGPLFAKTFANDPKRLAKLMNDLYGIAVPVGVATGAGAMLANPYTDESPIGKYQGGGFKVAKELLKKGNKIENLTSGLRSNIHKLNPLELKVGDFDIDKFNDVFRIPTQGTNSLTLPGSPNARTFISEIDWSKWNPETPNYPELITEYNGIEELTKKTGTWMKNPDGSPYQGTPEQFIQEQSSHFRKAYPEGYNEVFRGVTDLNSFKDFTLSKNPYLIGDKAIFTADKNLATSYAFNSGNVKPMLNPFISDNTGGVYDLIYPKGKQITYNTGASDWLDINLSKNATKENLQFQIDNAKKHYERLKNLAKDANMHEDVEKDILDGQKQIIENLQSLYDNFDNVIHDKEAFAEMRKVLGDVTTTDDIAQYLPQTDLRSVTLQNIIDGGLGDVTIVNNRPGNYLKSRVGNVGFFNMNNPNIYKGLVPLAVGAGAGALMANPYQDQSPIGKYKNGGQYGLGDEVDEATMKQLKKLGYTFEKI